MPREWESHGGKASTAEGESCLLSGHLFRGNVYMLQNDALYEENSEHRTAQVPLVVDASNFHLEAYFQKSSTCRRSKLDSRLRRRRSPSHFGKQVLPANSAPFLLLSLAPTPGRLLRNRSEDKLEHVFCILYLLAT